MKYDNSHNSMREFITYDFTSKYATQTQKKVVEDTSVEELYERHSKTTVDIWEGIV